MFRRLSSDLQALAGGYRRRPARPYRPSSVRRFFFVVCWRPGFAPGVWERLLPADPDQHGFRFSAEAERVGREVSASFDGIVAVQEGDASSWRRCATFKRPRAL